MQELRDAGYLPEAVRNYLALLGWGAGDDQTVLSTDELIERFTLERVSRNPARFDETKLRWLNGVYIRQLEPADLAQRLERFTGVSGLQRAAGISQEKIHTLADFMPLTGPLIDGAVDDPKARERWLGEDGRQALADARARARRAPGFREPNRSRTRSRAWSSAATPSRARSTSRCASRSPAPPSRPASSRASSCSAATRRCGAWTPRSHAPDASRHPASARPAAQTARA